MRRSNDTRLTQTTVKSALPRPQRFELWDSELAGFGLRIEPTGIKTFIVRYRAGGGRRGARRYIRIGRYGTITVDEARKQAKKLLGAAASGQDPANDRQTKRREITVAELVERYAEIGVGHLKPLTAQYTIARLRNHVVPLIGTTRVSDLRVADVEKLILQVAEGKTAADFKQGFRRRVIVKGGQGAAAKVVRDLSALMTFARKQEIVLHNPCAALRKPAFRQRERFLEPLEVAQLLAAAERLTREGVNPKVEQIIKLWFYTGCRNREVSGLRWSEVDMTRSQLLLDDTKTGRSARPLTRQAKQLLETIERDPNSDFVFPGERGDSHYSGVKRYWKKLLRYANLTGVTPHTLRHTLGSLAVSSGEPLTFVGRVLGHANERSMAVYAHLQPHALADSANRIGDIIAMASEPARPVRDSVDGN